MVVLSVTRLRLRSIRFLPSFLWWSLLSAVQAKRAPGNLSATGLRDSHLTDLMTDGGQGRSEAPLTGPCMRYT
jgi:hypothetical protein